MDLVKLLGENVKRERLGKGWSEEHISFEVDMKRSYVSDLERGVRNPSVKALGRLAEALGVEAADLLR